MWRDRINGDGNYANTILHVVENHIVFWRNSYCYITFWSISSLITEKLQTLTELIFFSVFKKPLWILQVSNIPANIRTINMYCSMVLLLKFRSCIVLYK